MKTLTKFQLRKIIKEEAAALENKDIKIVEEVERELEKQIIQEFLIEAGIIPAIGRGLMHAGRAIGTALFGGNTGATTNGSLASRAGSAVYDAFFGQGRGTPEQVKQLRTLMAATRSNMNAAINAFRGKSYPGYQAISKALNVAKKDLENAFASNNASKIKKSLQQSLTIQAYLDAFGNFGEDFRNILDTIEDDLKSGNKQELENAVKNVKANILRDLGAANFQRLGTFGRLGTIMGLKLTKVIPGLNPQEIATALVSPLEQAINKIPEKNSDSSAGVTTVAESLSNMKIRRLQEKRIRQLIKEMSGEFNQIKTTFYLLKEADSVDQGNSQQNDQAAEKINDFKALFDSLVQQTQQLSGQIEKGQSTSGTFGQQQAMTPNVQGLPPIPLAQPASATVTATPTRTQVQNNRNQTNTSITDVNTTGGLSMRQFVDQNRNAGNPRNPSTRNSRRR